MCSSKVKSSCVAIQMQAIFILIGRAHKPFCFHEHRQHLSLLREFVAFESVR